jgi:predicted anti-sigma-YlaC factor YlaD
VPRHGSPIDVRSLPDSGGTPDEVNCRQFVELVTDYFEGGLAASTLSRVEEHLVMCDWCVDYLDQYETTVSLLGELRADMSPGEPPRALLAALRERREPGS